MLLFLLELFGLFHNLGQIRFSVGGLTRENQDPIVLFYHLSLFTEVLRF
jgi:hypothetical protein